MARKTNNYSIVAFVDKYEQAGFQPVPLSPNAPGQLDLMLLPKDSAFDPLYTIE
jgi:hypothetical protein